MGGEAAPLTRQTMHLVNMDIVLSTNLVKYAAIIRIEASLVKEQALPELPFLQHQCIHKCHSMTILTPLEAIDRRRDLNASSQEIWQSREDEDQE